jgi:phosphoribosylanthranilate isomerase
MFVKICGITNEDDALLAVALGADALGFVFAPGSPRMVTPNEAADIVKRLPHDEVLTVGVFRDERPQRVAEIVNRVGLKGAQLHGREPPAEVAYVRKRTRFVIQGFAAGDPALEMAAGGPADIVLVDAPNPGSGQVFDWGLAKGVLDGARLLLAGGLTPDNVADAIWRVRPWGVDVSTGVETAPGSGRKDPRKLRRFIDAARMATAVIEGEGGNGESERSERDNSDRPPLYDWQAEGA